MTQLAPMPGNVVSWPPRAADVLAHLRHPDRPRLLELRHAVKDWARTFLTGRGFLEIDSPAFGPPVEEYGDLHFGIDIPDGRTLFLNHSPQFFKQAMIAAGYERCFQFAHCFRWEALDPNRTDQLRGLVQLDFEMRTEDDTEVRTVAEDLVTGLCDHLAIPCARPFPVLDGVECLKRYGTESPKLSDRQGELYPVWVVRSPLYDPRSADRPTPLRHPMARPTVDPLDPAVNLGSARTFSYDLVIAGSEIAGGALRVHDARAQEALLRAFRLPVEKFELLLEILADAPPHGGIAFGLDRLVSAVGGAGDVTKVNAFPQWII
jgi:aspartyl-tRNA synthetase